MYACAYHYHEHRILDIYVSSSHPNLRVDGSTCRSPKERANSELSSSLLKVLDVRKFGLAFHRASCSGTHTHFEAFPLPLPLPFLPPLLVGALLCLLASGCTSGSAATVETFSTTSSSPSLRGLKLLMVGMPILWSRCRSSPKLVPRSPCNSP